MWLIPSCIVVCACAAVGTLVLVNQRGEKPPVVSVGRAGEKPPVVGVSQAGDKPREVRKNVFFVELPDGSELNIRTLPAMSAPEPKVSDVDVALYGEPASKGWGANGVTTVHRVPEIKSYYALVKAMDDRIFIFFTWNAHYCTIDRKTAARYFRAVMGTTCWNYTINLFH